MNFTIRPFTQDDYETLATLVNTIYPEYPTTAEKEIEEDQRRDEKVRHGRFLAEIDGQPAGFGEYDQNPWVYHPQKFSVHIAVHPEWRRRGAGRALLNCLLADMQRYDPRLLVCRTREDHEGVAFVQRLGWQEIDRDWESRLETANFDWTPYASVEEQVAAHGIRITTLAELMQQDPDYRRKMYELDIDATNDVPQAQPITPPDFETYQRQVFEDKYLLPEAWFVALDGDQYVGTSNLHATPDPTKELNVGFTGVARSHRRKGIALALKLRTIAYAQAHGGPVLKTWNNSRNRPMLSINERLGFVKQPAWISFQKELGTLDDISANPP